MGGHIGNHFSGSSGWYGRLFLRSSGHAGEVGMFEIEGTGIFHNRRDNNVFFGKSARVIWRSRYRLSLSWSTAVESRRGCGIGIQTVTGRVVGVLIGEVGIQFWGDCGRVAIGVRVVKSVFVRRRAMSWVITDEVYFFLDDIADLSTDKRLLIFLKFGFGGQFFPKNRCCLLDGFSSRLVWLICELFVSSWWMARCTRLLIWSRTVRWILFGEFSIWVAIKLQAISSTLVLVSKLVDIWSVADSTIWSHDFRIRIWRTSANYSWSIRIQMKWAVFSSLYTTTFVALR